MRSLTTMLDRFAAGARSSYDADRRASPDRFTGSPDGLGQEFLFAANVARMLGCNVDHVRRIPRQALPASKVASRVIYARADVEAYIRGQRDAGTSRPVPSRKAVQPVAKRSPAPSAPADFCPIAHIRRQRAPR